MQNSVLNDHMSELLDILAFRQELDKWTSDHQPSKPFATSMPQKFE
jgi:hypothetical protein